MHALRNCVQPPKLAFPSSELVLRVGAPVPHSQQAFSLRGLISSLTPSPALPDGLQLDAKMGRLTGTPTAAMPKTTYLVTAVDASGKEAKASLQIEIVDPAVRPFIL